MFSYSAFGLVIRVNVAVPGLLPVPYRHSGAPSVSVHLGSLPPGMRATDDPVFATDGLSLHDSGQYIVFAYADGTRFAVRVDGAAVWGTWPRGLTLEDAATYLLGPVMAFVLRLHGRLALHAAVFAEDERAIAVAGGPEAGKSTLLGALVLRGVRVLSDDVAPLLEEEGRFQVTPTYPRVRLWDDSAAQLFGAHTALPLLTPNWEKRFFDVEERGLFERRPLPLAAVFVLAARAADHAPRVEELRAREAFVAVLAHLHSVWMLPRSPQEPIFALATRLTARVPVLRLVPHRDPARLDELCDVLLDAVARTTDLLPVVSADVSAG